MTRVHSFSPRGQCKKNCGAPASRWRTSAASRSAAAKQSRSTQRVPYRHANKAPGRILFSDNLIAQFFIIQSELSDQQRERLISAMSLGNISLENYTYEMMKTQYHDLFITTRTSIQDPSIRPSGGNRSNIFYILEQGEYKGEEGFWVEDKEGQEGFMPTNDEETFWVLEENDAFIARKVSGRIFRFKKRKGKENMQKGQSPTRWLQTLWKR